VLCHARGDCFNLQSFVQPPLCLAASEPWAHEDLLFKGCAGTLLTSNCCRIRLCRNGRRARRVASLMTEAYVSPMSSGRCEPAQPTEARSLLALRCQPSESTDSPLSKRTAWTQKSRDFSLAVRLAPVAGVGTSSWLLR
jgi:hypothetical protein